MCINYIIKSLLLLLLLLILAQCYEGWADGGRGWGGEGRGVGREEEKPPQVKTQDDQLPTDGPDHTTRPKGHHSGQG